MAMQYKGFPPNVGGYQSGGFGAFGGQSIVNSGNTVNNINVSNHHQPIVGGFGPQFGGGYNHCSVGCGFGQSFGSPKGLLYSGTNIVGGVSPSPLNSLLSTNASPGLAPWGIQTAVNQFTSGINTIGGFGGGLGTHLLGNLPLASQVLGGSQFGSVNNMVNPFTLASMPFGNPYLSPDMLAVQQQLQQAQQPQQSSGFDWNKILKTAGLVIGGLTLINLIKGNKQEDA